VGGCDEDRGMLTAARLREDIGPRS